VEAHERVLYLRLSPAGKQSCDHQLRGGVEAGEGQEEWRALPGAGSGGSHRADRSQNVDNVEEFIDAFEQDDFLKIKGWSTNTRIGFSSPFTNYGGWKKRRSITPTTFRRPQGHWRTLANADGVCRQFQNPHLKSLVELFMEDGRLPSVTAMRLRPRRCITLTSVDCWITWCRCFAPAI